MKRANIWSRIINIKGLILTLIKSLVIFKFEIDMPNAGEFRI